MPGRWSIQKPFAVQLIPPFYLSTSHYRSCQSWLDLIFLHTAQTNEISTQIWTWPWLQHNFSSTDPHITSCNVQTLELHSIVRVMQIPPHPVHVEESTGIVVNRQRLVSPPPERPVACHRPEALKKLQSPLIEGWTFSLIAGCRHGRLI